MKRFLFAPLFFTLWLISLQANAIRNEYYMVVAKDGSGEYRSIQKAIDNASAFPDKRITIFVKNGTYREKVVIPSWNNKITIKGENEINTIISYGDHFKKINRGRNSTFYTATVSVQADDARIESLTIENTAGDVGQAIALFAGGDRGVYKNIQLLGNQDTLYVAGQGKRQYFTQCYIEGTTDFIFGAATAVFEECQIHSKKQSYITAASTPSEEPYGLVFIRSKFTGEKQVRSTYLGRPWRPFAKTVLIQCKLGKHIHPTGWSPWNDRTPKEVFYAEYNSTGPGAVAEKRRVPWSHRLNKKQAKAYTKEKILLREKEFNWLVR